MDAPLRPAPLQLLGLLPAEWEKEVPELLRDLGQPPYRVRQLREWVFHKTPEGFEGMSDLPRDLRKGLEERAVLHPLRLIEEKVSADGTRKYLWARAGSGPIESVLIPEERSREEPGPVRPGERRDRITYCISTQAGCPVKCTFCATGYGGFEGQLSAAEVVDQVVQVRRISGRPPTNIVYMGMGEPLLNVAATMRSLEILGSGGETPRAGGAGLGLGARRITVSTVGVPERIVELGRRFPQVKLALSLHAARDDLRTEIIPLNRNYPLARVLESVREHHRITEKMPTFEYVLLPGVNDSQADARELGRILSGIPSRINLIEFNPFPEVDYRRPTVAALEGFRRSLSRHFHGTVTIRRSRGADIHGACGQLTLAAGRSAPSAARS